MPLCVCVCVCLCLIEQYRGYESACSAGDVGTISGLERSLGEGNSYPLQYSGLENSMDYTVHGVAQSQTRLSNCHFFLEGICLEFVIAGFFNIKLLLFDFLTTVTSFSLVHFFMHQRLLKINMP